MPISHVHGALCHPQRSKRGVTWHFITQAIGLQGDVQALPCHPNDDHHHLRSRTSDAHHTMSRKTWGHAGSTTHIIDISNTKLHGLNVSAIRGPLGCQASCGIIK